MCYNNMPVSTGIGLIIRPNDQLNDTVLGKGTCFKVVAYILM